MELQLAASNVKEPQLAVPISPRAAASLDVSIAREEIETYFVTISQFPHMDMAEVLLNIAAMSARAAELRQRFVRDASQRSQAFRTRELDPFLDALDLQFRIYSRVASVRQFEWDMAKGGA